MKSSNNRNDSTPKQNELADKVRAASENILLFEQQAPPSPDIAAGISAFLPDDKGAAAAAVVQPQNPFLVEEPYTLTHETTPQRQVQDVVDRSAAASELWAAAPQPPSVSTVSSPSDNTTDVAGTSSGTGTGSTATTSDNNAIFRTPQHLPASSSSSSTPHPPPTRQRIPSDGDTALAPPRETNNAGGLDFDPDLYSYDASADNPFYIGRTAAVAPAPATILEQETGEDTTTAASSYVSSSRADEDQHSGSSPLEQQKQQTQQPSPHAYQTSASDNIVPATAATGGTDASGLYYHEASRIAAADKSTVSTKDGPESALLEEEDREVPSSGNDNDNNNQMAIGAATAVAAATAAGVTLASLSNTSGPTSSSVRSTSGKRNAENAADDYMARTGGNQLPADDQHNLPKSLRIMPASDLEAPTNNHDDKDLTLGDGDIDMEAPSNSKKGTKSKNGKKDRRSRSATDWCCLMLAPLFWIGLLAMMYFLVAWSVQSGRDDGDDNVEGSTETKSIDIDDTNAAPTRTPALAGSSAPTMSPTTEVEALWNLLQRESLDGGLALQNTSSPQYQAFDWLASNANLSEYSNPQQLSRYALATFYYSTGGNETWLDQADWLNEDLHECEWFRSWGGGSINTNDVCDRQGNLLDLEISYNNLRGTLPPELAFLSNSLETIHIAGGPSERLSGPLPVELGYLTKLQQLRIPSNRFTGTTLPLANWTKLRSLTLKGNEFSGTLPSDMGVMTDLFSFSAEGNRFTGPIPTSLGFMTSLKTINLNRNSFTRLPSEIGLLTDLIFLELDENELQGSLTSDIGNLGELRTLLLSRNNLNHTIPSTLGNLWNLRELDLSENSLSGSIPTELALIPYLRTLNLQGNALTGSVPQSFANFLGIQTLQLHTNNLTDSVPDVVCSVFNESLPMFSIDCQEITCSCCNICCIDDAGCACRYVGTDDQWICN